MTKILITFMYMMALKCIHANPTDLRSSLPRGCSGSQKIGARKIARCQFRSRLKNLQGANFFEPKLDDCMYHYQFHV